MSNEKRPLPAAVSEHTNDHPNATSTEVMEVVGLDERFREQVEHYCAITWFTLFKNEKSIDPESL